MRIKRRLFLCVYRSNGKEIKEWDVTTNWILKKPNERRREGESALAFCSRSDSKKKCFTRKILGEKNVRAFPPTTMIDAQKKKRITK